MFHGKQLKITRKSVVLLISLSVLFCSAIGGTAAYLFTKTEAVTNTFEPSRVTTAVTDEYKIQNTGDTTAWIRAAVVVTWQDADGNVYGQMPGDDDYEITYNVDNTNQATDKWHLGADGFYYWPTLVAVNESTGILIESCNPKPKGTAPDGYYLTVEILGSGIQTFQGEIDTYSEAWAKVVAQ